MNDCDELPDEEWPNDDEANDIVLAYAADDVPAGSGSGCAGVVLILIIVLTALLCSIF